MASSDEVIAWQAEGKKVHPITHGARRTGGWPQVFVDMEFFVKRESERARAAGKKLFLWGHSMVSESFSSNRIKLMHREAVRV